LQPKSHLKNVGKEDRYPFKEKDQDPKTIRAAKRFGKKEMQSGIQQIEKIGFALLTTSLISL